MRTLHTLVALAFASVALCARSAAAQIAGQVLGAGSPIAGSTVTLWAAGDTTPMKVAQTKTDADGRFELTIAGSRGAGRVLYIIANGGQPKARGGTGENP